MNIFIDNINLKDYSNRYLENIYRDFNNIIKIIEKDLTTDIWQEFYNKTQLFNFKGLKINNVIKTKTKTKTENKVNSGLIKENMSFAALFKK